MSGGHYDYYQWHIADVADKMEEDLARIGTQNQWEDVPYGLEDSTIAALRMAISLLRASADIVHDIDWCMSGDTGEDTLRRDLYKWSLKHEVQLEKSIDRALDYMESK